MYLSLTLRLSTPVLQNPARHGQPFILCSAWLLCAQHDSYLPLYMCCCFYSSCGVTPIGQLLMDMWIKRTKFLLVMFHLLKPITCNDAAACCR
jgi:hypothetical protein